MTVAMDNGTERRAAVEAWQEAAAAGERISGAQLGKRFGRSERWGRARIAEARNGLTIVPPPSEAPKEPDHGERRPAAALRTSPAEHGTATTRERHDRVPPGTTPSDGALPRPWYDTMITAAVALVAAAASYLHMYDVALMAGEPVWIARAFPIAVDGVVLAALRRGERGRAWLVLGLGVSVAANIAAQFPELATQAGPFVSAWPPVALYGTHRLLYRQQ